MSDNKVNYRTVQGFIFAGPFDRKAGTKNIRDILISTATPEGEQVVRVTIWDTHKDQTFAVGDYVICNGKYEIFKAQQEDGEFINKHSCSANKVLNIGSGLGTYDGPQSIPDKTKRVVKKDIDF